MITLIFLSRFLGCVNSVGTAFEAPTLATGLGGYIAQVPAVLSIHLYIFQLMVKFWQINAKVGA